MRRFLYFLLGDDRILGIDAFNRVGVTSWLPSWLLFLCCIGAAVFAWYAYRRAKNISRPRRRTLTALRACVYIAMLLMLARPTMLVDGEGKSSGPLPVVVDRTESMGIEDLPAFPRVKEALLLKECLAENAGIAPPLKQVNYVYGPQVRKWEDITGSTNETEKSSLLSSAPVKVAGQRTSVKEMIADSLRDHLGSYCGGVLVISDGANNAPDYLDSMLEDLRKRNIPVYFAPVGQENPKDISLENIIGEDIVFVNEKTRHFVSVVQNGFTGRQLRVRASFGNEPVSAPDFVPEREGESSFPVEFKPTQPGLFDLAVEIPPEKEESATENNKISRKIRVIKEKIRILMVFNSPSWEYRYLVGAFERDRRIDNKIYLHYADKRIFKQSQEKYIERLPAEKKDLFAKFDLIIISKMDVGALPPAFRDMLHDFVAEDGGGVAFLSDGRDIPYSLGGTKLEPMLPVKLKSVAGPFTFSQEMFKTLETPYSLEVTEDGMVNPLTTFDPNRARNKEIWSQFPPNYEMCATAELKPSAIPLVNAYTSKDGPRWPAIAYQYYGKGIVLYMGFDSSWRWRKEHGDRYFREFWGKSVQFLGLPHLLGEPAQARIFLDRVSASVGEKVVITASVRNRDYSPLVAEKVAVSVTQPDQKDRDLVLQAVPQRPGVFRATFYPENEGNVSFRLPPEFQSEPMELSVQKVNREFQDSGVKLAFLSDIARKTVGQVFYQSMTTWHTNLSESVSAGGQPIPAATGSFGASFGKQRAEREKELADLHEKIARSAGNPYADKEYLRKLAQHILKTISENRVPIPIVIERDLWDSLGLMILALLILCAEYALRKIWYLD